MAFKMKGPMFFGSAIKKYGKKSEPVAKMKKKDGDAVMMKRDKMEAKADAIEGGMPSDVADKVFKKKKDKEGSGMNYGSSTMKHYSSHKEYMTHDPSEGPMSDKRHNHPDKPASNKVGSGMNYGKKMKPATKMSHGGKDKKGGPKMTDDKKKKKLKKY